MSGAALLAVVAVVVYRAHRERVKGDRIGSVAPRPGLEGGTFWRNGRRVSDRWDSHHAARCVEARRRMQEYGEAA